MPITTDRDARQFVIAAIEAGDATRAEFGIDAICAELRTLAGGWDFTEIDHDTFWAVVAKHADR